MSGWFLLKCLLHKLGGKLDLHSKQYVPAWVTPIIASTSGNISVAIVSQFSGKWNFVWVILYEDDYLGPKKQATGDSERQRWHATAKGQWGWIPVTGGSHEQKQHVTVMVKKQRGTLKWGKVAAGWYLVFGRWYPTMRVGGCVRK